MTKCNVSIPVFQGPKSRKIEFNFSGGDISSDGGLLFVKEFDRKLGLTRRAGKLLESFDIRQPGKVEHSCLSMLRQRVFGLIAGHEDLSDHHELRNDPLIQTVVGRDGQLAAPSTLCRFENGINRRVCVDLSRLFVEFFIESFSTPPRELILDFDATDDLTYGMQENRFTNLDDDGQYLYEKVYCARGEMENRIKEQQLELFADRTSCHDFAANQFRLLLSSLAYILMERFRTLLLNGTKFAQATCDNIRLYLVKIGAVIRRNTRKIYVALSSACPNQELLRLIGAKIIAME